MFVHDPNAAGETVSTFYNIGSFGWASFASLALYFTFVFTENKKALKSRLLYPFLMAPPLFFVYLQWVGVLPAGYIKQPWGWAYVWSNSIWTYLFYLYFFVFMAAALYLLMICRRKTGDKLKKKQITIILSTAIASLALASLTDIILPGLNIYAVPNIAPSFVLIFAFGLVYAITRYELILSPGEIAARAEQQWEKTFNAMADGMFITSADFEILNINSVLCGILKKEKKELIGQKCYRVFHGKNQPIHNCPLERAKRSKKTEHAEFFEPHLNRWLNISSSPLLDEEGEVSLIIHNVRDVSSSKSAAKKVRESEERYRDLFENANDLIQSVDADGKFNYVNKKWLDTLGYTRGEVKNLNLQNIIRKDQVPHCMEIFKRVCGGENMDKVETVFVSKSGKDVYVEGSANAQFKEGKFVATQGMFRDVTARKMAEEKLEKKMDDVGRFNKLAVGRELKMKELKKRIAELEAKLNGGK